MDDASIDASRTDLALFGPGLAVIASQHSLSGEPHAYTSGSLPTFAIGDAVVKLYHRKWPLDVAAERAVLERVGGELPIPTPALLAQGELDGWDYLVMSRLEGEPLEEVLPRVSPERRVEAMHTLGGAVAALHRVGVDGLPSYVTDYDAFDAAQVAGAVDKQRGRGLDEARLARVEPFLRDTPVPSRPHVLLHTELGPGHVLATVRDGAIHLGGMIDFVDAMAGPPTYDFAALAFFVVRGESGLLDAFLDGYGWDGPRGRALALILTRHLLTHRFANVPWYLRLRPSPALELQELAATWVGWDA